MAASVCATCKFAEWRLTANGRRHPDGSGRCVYQFPDGPLPKWSLHTNYVGSVTTVRGVLSRALGGNGYIYRTEAEPRPCATWEQK